MRRRERLESLLTGAEVCEVLRISRTSLWRMTKRGDFPRPMKINGHIGRYRPEWVADFLRRMELERDES